MYAKWINDDQRFAFAVNDNGGVKITSKEWSLLLAGQSDGKMISKGAGDFPLLIDVVLDVPDSAVRERMWRDGELASVMWLRERHRDQVEIKADTTLSTDQFKELMVYMQALRDWPQSAEFPGIEHRPAALAWLSEQQKTAHAAH
ncbi:phage tail assembly chaperone [Pseudomonas antarctica]|uniref:phage tail assembly chaperone n=1 Tax=Pseudomonas antarctica TaxID=219572 RepID=UPI00387B6BD5